MSINSVNTAGTNNLNKAGLVNFGQTKNKKEEKDPYRSYPLRGAAYMNELGVALQPKIGPGPALALWAPALAYFGMDINDKYQKGTNGKDKDTRTGVQAAVFHSLASIIFPTAVIHAAQKYAMETKIKGKTLFERAYSFVKKNGPKAYKDGSPVNNKVLKGWTENLHRVPVIGKVLVHDPVEEIKLLTKMNLKNRGAQKFSTAFKTAVGLGALAVAAVPIDMLTEKVFMKPVNYALGLKEDHDRHEKPIAAKQLDAPEKLLTLQSRLK